MLLIRPGRLFAVWLIALLLCVLPRTGAAAMMRHHDLASLAMLSDAIVLARRIRSETRDHREIVHHEVIKVYRGPVAVGDRIPVDCGSYILNTSRWSPREAPPAALSDQVVLFLVRRRSAGPGTG